MKRLLLAVLIMLFAGMLDTVLGAETALNPDNVPRMSKEQLMA